MADLTPDQIFLDSIDVPFGYSQEFLAHTSIQYRESLVSALTCWGDMTISEDQAAMVINRILATRAESSTSYQLYKKWAEFCDYCDYYK